MRSEHPSADNHRQPTDADPSIPTMSRRQRRDQAYEAAKTGGLRSVAIFLVTLLVLGGCGWVVYGRLTNRNLAETITHIGSGPTLTIGTMTSPGSLDIRTQEGDAVTQALLGNVYETLLGRDENNRAAAGLAASWDASSDGLTYTFRLHRHMTFSNGDVLNADDVVWSLQQTTQNRYVGADRLTNLASVSAKDADTVVITLNAPNPELPWALSGRAGIVYDQDARFSPSTDAVGSGPFVVEDWDKDASLTLRANADYWGTDKAKVGTVTFRYYTDAATAADDLTNGRLDALVPADTSTLDALRDDGDITVAQGDSSRKLVLGFNSSADSLFSEIRLRTCARMAIDKQKLIDADGAAGALGGPLTVLDPGYEDLTGLYPYNPDLAREQLSYFNLSTTRRLVYPERYGEQIGRTIADALNAVGLHIETTMVDDATWQRTVVQDGQFDLTIFEMPDSHDMGDYVAQDNFLHYTNSVTEGLYADAMAATNQTDYEARLGAYARQLSQDSPVDWLYVSRPWVAYRGNVRNLPINMVESYLPLATVEVR